MSEQREIDGVASEGAAGDDGAKGSAQAGSTDEVDRPEAAGPIAADESSAVGSSAVGTSAFGTSAFGTSAFGTAAAGERVAESEEAVGAAPRDQAGSAWSGRAVGPLSRLLPGGSVDPLLSDVPAVAAGGDREPVVQRPEDARESAEPGSAAETEPAPAIASAVGQPDDASEVSEPDEPVGVAEGDVTEAGVTEAGVTEAGVTEAGVTEAGKPFEAVVAAEAGRPFEAVVAAGVGEPFGAVVAAEAGPTSAEDRWHDVLAGFVDDPRGSVEAASALIDEDIARHFALLARHKETMRAAWGGDVDADTEALRVSLVNYRDLRKRLADVATVLSR